MLSSCPWSICLFVAPRTSRGSWLLERHPAESDSNGQTSSPISRQHENVFIFMNNEAINRTSDVNYHSPTEIAGPPLAHIGQGHGRALYQLPERCWSSSGLLGFDLLNGSMVWDLIKIFRGKYYTGLQYGHTASPPHPLTSPSAATHLKNLSVQTDSPFPAPKKNKPHDLL